MAELKKKEVSQWEAQTDPDPANRMPPEIFRQLNAKLLREKEEVQAALCKAYEAMPEPVNYEERMQRFQDALDALQDDEVDAATKNRLLKACIDRIDYTREKAQRIKSQQKRVKIDGERRWVSPLPTGANWTTPPFELDVKLRL